MNDDASPKMDRPTILLFQDLLRFRPNELTVTFLLILARSVSEGIGLMMLVPLLRLAGGGGASGLATDEQNSSWLSSLLPIEPTIEHMMAVFLLLILTRAVLGYASTMAAQRYQTSFGEHMRWRVYRSHSRANWLFLTSRRHGLDLHALTDQTSYAATTAHYVISLAAGTLTVLTGLTVAFLLSPWLTLYVVASGLLIVFPLVIFHRRAYARGKQALAASSKLYDVLVARLSTVKLAKAFATERRLEQEFSTTSSDYRRAELAAHENSAQANLFQDFSTSVLLVAMVYVALQFLSVPQVELILLIVIFARIAPLCSNVARSLRSLAQCLPSYVALRAREAEALAAEEVVPSFDGDLTLRNSVALKNVRFAYPDDPDRIVLDGVSIDFKAGSATSIVGLSGAGKSTLADIVAGMHGPDDGDMLIDGEIMTAERRGLWRANVSYVPQDAPLFHGTIRENLIFGKPTASDAEIWEALDTVRAAKLVRELPDGLETMAGERGVRLSGGEQQRIRLASALLRRPQLLILDEATSALNSRDEMEIVIDLRARHPAITVILVTHRDTSIDWTDRALLLRNGRIIFDGSPADIPASFDV